MDELGPFYTRSSFWRKFITFGLFALFILAFWSDIGPALRGWMNFLLVIFTNKTAEFDAITLSAILKVTLNVVVYLVIYVLSLFVVAQFTLPVQSWKERRSAFNRLILFLFHWHGPIALIREGKYVVKDGDDDNTNPGVALVDLSSAIVLEQLPWEEEPDETQEKINPAKLEPSFLYRKFFPTRREEGWSWLRVSGPGVNFIESGERIHSVVDLRRQVRIDPSIKATTRDGIEIETPVFSVFSISDPPDVIPVAYVGGTGKENLYALDITEYKENKAIQIKGKFELDPIDAEEIHRFVEAGGVSDEEVSTLPPSSGNVKTPYHYDADRVFMAACAEAGHVSPEEKNPLWHQLPQYIAIEIFRNLLAQYTYDYIYSPVSEQSAAVGSSSQEVNTVQPAEPFIKIFKKEFNREVMYQGILSYKLVRLSSSKQTMGRRIPKWNALPLTEKDCNSIRIRSASEFEMSSTYPLSASKVLRDRGIKVVAVGFPEFKSPPEIRSQIADSWKAYLERQIEITRAKHEREVVQVINSARTQTQRESTYFLSNIFKNETYSQEALALLLFQSLENAATDPNSYKDIPPKEILAMLQNLHRWLLVDLREADRKDKSQKGEDNPVQPHPPKEPI